VLYQAWNLIVYYAWFVLPAVCRGNAIALVLIQHGHPVHAVIILPSVHPFKDEAQTAEFKDPVRNRAANTFQLRYKNQSVYGVSGTSRGLF
jgi:hypothetical protein